MTSNGKPNGELLLEMRGLRIEGQSDEKWHEIVHGVDVTLRRGEVLGLIGESGAGKSTIGIASMALSAWGTSNMRTGGDDIAQALALLGVRPTWEVASRRVTGFEILPLSVLDRPRVDVTLRISGFFRDAFPLQIDLFDSAVRAVCELDEPDDMASRLPAGNRVVCTLNEEAVPRLAADRGTTRSAAAVDLWAEDLPGAIVAIGNAPTALFRLLELLDEGVPPPAAIFGFPVGFVGAAESKDALAEDMVVVGRAVLLRAALDWLGAAEGKEMLPDPLGQGSDWATG